MKNQITFTKADAKSYQATTDKAAFLVELLGLFSINQLTPELEDEAEAELFELLKD
jgi:hypothetical protein